MRAAMVLYRCENDWPDGKPDDRGLLLRWNGMSEDERDEYTNRVLPVLEAFLDTRRKLCYSGCVHT